MSPDLASDPQVKELTKATQSLVERAATYVVTTATQYSAAGQDLMSVKGARDRLEKIRKSFTAPLDQAKKAIMDFFRGPTEQLDRAESQIKRAMIGFTQEQERLRREEQARADEAARKEQEKLQQQAARAAESGKTEKAGALQQRAASVVAPVINREPPKVAGISARENWYAECTDLRALVMAIAEGNAPLSFVMANDKVLGAQARNLKSEFVVPGVRVWSEGNIASAKGGSL